jgi:hypothetical protein
VTAGSTRGRLAHARGWKLIPLVEALDAWTAEAHRRGGSYRRGVSLFSFRRRTEEPPPEPVERPEVTAYRQLLETAGPELLERVHIGALRALDPLVRAQVLLTVQHRLLNGRDLTVDDIPQLAHLVVAGETRTPGIVVSGLSEMALGRLATAVNRQPSAAVLLEPRAPVESVTRADDVQTADAALP